MLIPTQVVYGSAVEALDGPVGSVQDLFFHEETWHVGLASVDVGGWLEDRQILLAPSRIERRDWVERRLELPLSREQVQAGRPLDARPGEMLPVKSYTDGVYWQAIPLSVAGLTHDRHLHSCRHTIGFSVEAYDGLLGTVKDVIVDDDPWDRGTWPVRYLVVDARQSLGGRFVVISPLWLEAFDWDGRRLRAGMLRDTIEHSPHYDPTAQISRSYEDQLHDYYNMPKYWAGHPV